MKRLIAILYFTVPLALLVYSLSKIRAAETDRLQAFEYATIRRAGRDNTHIIRPNGKVEKLRPSLDRHQRPDGTDERAYYLSVAMNAAAREGFEFVGSMNSDEVIMKRNRQQ